MILQNAIADVERDGIRVFVSTKATTCAESRNVVMAEDGLAFLVPFGPAGDFFRGKEVGVDAWLLQPGEGRLTTLAAPFFRVRVMNAAMGLAGTLRFEGRTHSFDGNGGNHFGPKLSGSGAFDVKICPLAGQDGGAPKWDAPREGPFRGVVTGTPFTAARAFAILCRTPETVFIQRLELSEDPTATCADRKPAKSRRVSLSSVGGSERLTKAFGVAQPARVGTDSSEGGMVGDVTGTVLWQSIDFVAGGSAKGIASAEMPGRTTAPGGGAAVSTGGAFDAIVCDDQPPPLNHCPRL